MARMTAGSMVGAYALGVVGAAFLLPQTAWIPANHVDVLTHGWGNGWWDMSFSGDNSYLPRRIVDPATWTAQTSDSRLAIAIGTTSPQPFGRVPQERPLRALERHCRQNPSDTRAWAQLVRLGSLWVRPKIDGDAGQVTSENGRTRREMTVLVMEACLRCEPRDPDNAFFPLMRAGCLAALGRIEEARDLFRSAATMPQFEDYASTEADVKEAAVAQRWGYRGQIVRAYLLGGTLLPHYSTILSLASSMVVSAPKLESLRSRLAAAQLGRLLAREGDDHFALVIGYAIFRTAIFGRWHPKVLTIRERTEATQAFRAELRSAGLPDTEIQKISLTFGAMANQLSPSWTPPEGGLAFLSSRRPLYGAGVLLAILLVAPCFVVIRWLGARSGPGTSRPVVAGLGVLLASAFGAAACVLLLDGTHNQQLAALLAVAAVASVLGGGIVGRTAKVSTGLALGVLGVAYLGVISWELQDDARLGSICDALVHDADRVRSESGAFSVLSSQDQETRQALSSAEPRAAAPGPTWKGR